MSGAVQCSIGDPMATPPQPPPPPPPRRRWRWTALIVAVVFVLILAVGALLSSGILRRGTPIDIAAGAGILLVASELPSGMIQVRALVPDRHLDRVVYEGAELTQMRVSPDGQYALLAARSSSSRLNDCYLIDLRGDSPPLPIVPEAVPGASLPRPVEVTSVDWLADGRAVFALLYGLNTVVVTSYDPATGERELLARVPDCLWVTLLCPHAAPAPALMGLVDLVGQSGVMVIDEKGATSATGYPIPHWGIASPSGASVLVQETAASLAWAIYPVTKGAPGREIPIDTPHRYYTCADWSPSGKRVAIGPVVYDAATGQSAAVLKVGGEVEDVWFLDDSRLAVLAGGQVLLADADTGAVGVLVSEPVRLPRSAPLPPTWRRWLGL